MLGVQGLSPTGISNNKGVQPVEHSDEGLSLTAKQTFEIAQQGVCPGSVPNRDGWRKSFNPSPNPSLSPTGIMRLVGQSDGYLVPGYDRVVAPGQ